MTRFSFLFLPGLLGVFSVLQAGLNRKIAATAGLASAALLNNTILLVSSLFIYLAFRAPEDSVARATRAVNGCAWIPGLLGLSLVMGIPFAISRIGGLQVFIIMIATQLLGGLAWDAAFENRPVTAIRLSGALLSLLGAVIVSMKE